MREKLAKIIQEAKDLDILNSGSVLVLADSLQEYENKRRKNLEQIQRLMGENQFITYNLGVLYTSINKFIALEKAELAKQETSIPTSPALVEPKKQKNVEEVKTRPNRKKK